MNSPKQLAITQVHFQDNILTGDAAIDSEIEGDTPDFRNTRLGIYRDAHRLRLIGVLRTDYKVLHSYLGDEVFDAVAGDYIAAHPSTFRNVRWFGGKLAEFLGSIHRCAAHPELAELARFEWSLGQAFDSPDEDAARFEDVAAVASEAWVELRFRAHPALRVLALRTNAVAIWKAIDKNDEAPEPVILSAPVTWAIWREQYSPFFRSLEADEAWALQAMLAQSSFGEICVGLCEWVAEEAAAARAAGLLRGWVAEGWIAESLVAN